MTGRIVRLVREKGFGFIRDSNGVEYFFHASALIGVNFQTLSGDEAVTFEESEGDKGPRAEAVELQ